MTSIPKEFHIQYKGQELEVISYTIRGHVYFMTFFGTSVYKFFLVNGSGWLTDGVLPQVDIDGIGKQIETKLGVGEFNDYGNNQDGKQESWAT
jgi:hypothetical protein